jgi:hypothetical protein
MPINSQDDLATALAAGQTNITIFNKLALAVTAQVAGAWYDLSKGGGAPAGDSLIGSGTNLTFQPVSESTTTTATTAANGGSIAGTTFTDTTHGTGRFTVGQRLTGAGVTIDTFITAYGTGIGANSGGTYTVNNSQTVTAQTITGTAIANFMPHGGNVSAAVKQLLNASIFSAAASSVPAIFMAIDIIGFIPVSTVTLATAQAILGSQAYPRYADGKGVQAMIVPIIAMGAGSPTLQLNYTNPSNVAGRVTPVVPSLPIATSACPAGQIIYSGTGVGKVGPQMPLAAGDNGILSIQSITQNATMTSGVYVIVLYKPISLPFPLTTIGVAAERDFFNQLPSMPIVPDGACISLLQYAGVGTPINTPYFGSMQTVWKT